MNTISKISLVTLGILSSGVILSTTVFAVDLPTQTGNRGLTQVSPRSSSSSSQAAIRKEEAQTRLQDAKLKACQAREDAIKKRSTRLTEMANNMLSKFDSIASRVEDYYTNKVVPSGKTVTNYDSLVSDIGTKKAAVQSALTAAQTDIAGFSCDGSDPKGQMTKFRDDMQNVKTALKDYRTSIKNLIVAVHSVTGAENRENLSNSPKPTRSPNQGDNQP